MTKKHKIGKSKHLLESKKDVDENVENILRMIGEENEQAENEQDDFGNPVKKSKLSSLVKGFHEDYQYLHKHYKQLISKLENVGHSSSGSDSSDSDMEGDRSNNNDPTPKTTLNEENGLNHRFADHSMEAEIEKLKQCTEEQHKEISDLKQLLDKAMKDKEATRAQLSSEVANLSSENENLKSLVETSKREEGDLLNAIKSKENEVKILSGEKQTIEEERDNLKMSIVDMEGEKEDLSRQLRNAVDKCSILSSELEKAQQAENQVQALLEENQKLKDGNLILSVEYDDLKALHQNLDIECSQLKATIAKTKAENESLIIENHSAERKLQQLGVEIDGLKAETVELMNNMNRERSTAAEEKERLISENSMYLNELEEAQSRVKDLEKELESTKSVLNSNIAELQKEKNFATSEIERLGASLTNLENDLAQQLERVADMQKTNEGLGLANSNLHNEIAEVQGQKNEAASYIVNLESKLEQQVQEISNLKEANRELKAAKADLYNEVTVLQQEKNVAFAQLQQSEAYIKNLQSDLEQHHNQISVIQQANEEMQDKNSSLHKQLEETRTNLQEEIVVLQGEKEEVINSLQQSNDSVKALEVQLEQQREQISVLQLANEDLQNSNSNLMMQLEEVKVSHHAEILALQDEKNQIISELQQSEASIKDLKIELEQGKEQTSILHLANEDMKNNIDILDKQLEEVRSSLHAEIAELRAEKDTALSELQMSQTSVRNIESVLEMKSENISTLEKANDHLQKNLFSLTEQSEQTKAELQKEVEVIQEEKDIALKQLKQSETSVQNLEDEVIRLKEELSIQLENNSTLDKQFEEARSNLHAKIAELRAEKDTSLLKLQTCQASVTNLEIVLEKQTENISTLQQANDELQKNIYTLTEQSEQAKVELQKEFKAVQEEKDAVVTQLKQSETSVQNLENEVTRLKQELSVQLENNSTLDKQLEEAILKVSNLHENLEKAQAEAACQIDDMSTKTKDLEKTINLLSAQKIKLEEDLKCMIEACTENMSLMTGFEDRITQKISDHEVGLTALYESLKGVVVTCQRLQHAYDEVSTRASQLNILKRSQIERIDQLEVKNTEIMDKHRLLEEEKLSTNKENTKLQKHVQDLEVQLQLAKQKLKVTEAESKCKDDSHAAAVETSQAEILHLEKLVQQFSRRVSSLEEALMQVKGLAESGVSELADKLGELETLFNQSFVLLVDRSSSCIDELKVLRKKVGDHLNEQRELVNVNNQLAFRLKEKERVVSEMVKSAAEAEAKMVQLEKTVEDKEDELAARVQEKREAIKQLSDAIVYHKNYSDDLVRYIRSQNRPRLPFCL